MAFNIAGIGVGEGGGRIAMSMTNVGINIGAINTNAGDLSGLNNIPESKKMLIDISGGGSGKDPNFVKQSVQDPETKKSIVRFIKNILENTPIYTNCSGCSSKQKLKDTEAIGDDHKCDSCGNTHGITKIHREKSIKHDYLFLFACLGGGSGSGLVGEIVDICVKSKSINIPIAVVCTLPDDSEDSTTKRNAVSVFKDLYNEYATKEIISPLILIDNQKMQEIIDVPLGSMYSVINNSVTGLIDKFNQFSNQTSQYMSTIDTMDTARLWATGRCCSIGRFIVGKSKIPRNKGVLMVDHPLALDEVEQSIRECTFVDGFDLSTANGIGIIAVAPKHFLDNENVSKCIRYAFGISKDIIGGDGLIFRGQYDDEETDCLEFYIFYNGLEYPKERFERMWDAIKEGAAVSQRKKNVIDSFAYNVDMESNEAGANFKKLQSLKTAAADDDDSEEFVDTRKLENRKKKQHKPCDNCFIDPVRKVSMGVYRQGGPMPFDGRMCPKCKGSGKI